MYGLPCTDSISMLETVLQKQRNSPMMQDNQCSKGNNRDDHTLNRQSSTKEIEKRKETECFYDK